MYGLPNYIHKAGSRLRPILSMVATFNHSLGLGQMVSFQPKGASTGQINGYELLQFNILSWVTANSN